MQFATKPELAQKMLQRAFKAEVPAAWVTADEVYGGNRRLRLWLEEQQQAYVMAVSTLEAIEIDARNAQSQSTSIHCRGDCVAAHQLRRWHKRTAIR
jgi:SRSO17 transposase